MKISSNYNIIPNLKYYNAQQNQNKSQNSVQNSTYIENRVYNCNMYTTQNIAFKASVNPVNVEKILNRNIVFGLDEYKKLSNRNLKILREYGKSFKEADERVVNFILKNGKRFADRLHEKYPDGFIFVSEGRSPAFIAKYLELQGEEVKYCPMSFNTGGWKAFSPEAVEIYKKYLDTIGFTKEFAENSQKPIIIADYTVSGATLTEFKDFLESAYNIKAGPKLKYCPLTADHCTYSFDTNDCIFSCTDLELDDRYFYRNIMFDSLHKKYSPIPWIGPKYYDETKETFDKFFQSGNKFEEDFNVKMMNFLMADSIYNKETCL